ncbi:MAG: hypothetical protein MJ250_08865 [Alphaproteobacteria bacterium]|nr:hypothetical protein [Alphaproteobacteria bacterium]
MDKNHLDEDFARVGELYVTYKNALLDIENNASVIESTIQKIVGEFWKITQKVKTFTPDMKENSVLIVKTIKNCLKTYPDKEPEEFCKLTFTSIKNKLSGAASTSAFEEKTGMHITDSEDRKRKKIEKAYKQYVSINKENKRAFIEYAIVYLGFNREDLETYLFPVTTSSLFVNNKNGEEVCVGDTEDAKNVFDASTEKTDKNLFKTQLDIINKAWLKQKEDSKTILSVAITVDLLGDFAKFGGDESSISVLWEIEFVDKKILENFISDKNYKLPTQSEIGDRFGITKSAISVKVTRFIKTIRE